MPDVEKTSRGEVFLRRFANDTIRVEIGPQIVPLKATPSNLSNDVTHPNYQLGRPDAFGKPITDGAKMNVVDWRAKIAPRLWKLYVWNDERVVPNMFGADETVPGFEKVAEYESEDKAVDHAQRLAKGSAA